MRFAVAIVVVGVAFAAAVAVHQRDPATSWNNCSDPTSSDPWGGGPCSGTTTHPSWEDPAAVLIAIGGIAVAVGIVPFRRRRSPS